jgi:16S rRNA (guanine(527)-N(7))-methyltransferase RsmG
VKHLPSDETMKADLKALSICASNGQIGLLRCFCGLVGFWSKRVNLVGPLEMERLWRRHVLESASWCAFVPEGCPACDIGSGAGFPGVVLSILGRTMTLLEPRRPRYLFLTALREELGLSGLRIEKARIEEMASPEFPIYTARSVGPPPRILEALQKAGAAGGVLVCRLGPSQMPGPGAERTIELKVPPLDRPGVLVQYRVPATTYSSLRRK